MSEQVKDYIQAPGGKRFARGTANQYNYTVESRVINGQLVDVKVYPAIDDKDNNSTMVGLAVNLYNTNPIPLDMLEVEYIDD